MNQHVTEKSTWGLAALFLKAKKQSRLAERKVGCILDASNCRELSGGRPSKAVPTTNKQGVRDFIDWGGGERVGTGQRGYMQKQRSQLCQSSANWSSVV